MNQLQGNISNNNPLHNYTSSLPLRADTSAVALTAAAASQQQQQQQYSSEMNSKIQSIQPSMKGQHIGGSASIVGMTATDYLKTTALNNNNSNSANTASSGAKLIVSTGSGGQLRRDSNSSGAIGPVSSNNQIKHQQVSSQSMSIKEEDGHHLHHHHHHLQLNMSSSHSSQHQQLSQGQSNMDIEKGNTEATSSPASSSQPQNIANSAGASTIGISNQQQGISQNGQALSNTANASTAQSSSSPSQSITNKTPAINRIDAQDVIINFKKHLLDKWKKNKAKQHVNKIIHYHVQHTFFLRYAAPLFLKDYQELLNQNLASAGQNSNNREQGLISTLKQINQDILNGSKKTKSVDVLQSYLTKLDEKDQLNQFLDVLVFILFGEIPYQIPSELNERKKNLFHYVSPIIAFLIIFYIHAEKKPVTLDELVTRSGLKQLYKNIKVPCKDTDMDDPNGTNANDSDSDEEDEMIDEDGESAQQNSGPQTSNNIQSTASKQQPSNTSQQQSTSLSHQQKNITSSSSTQGGGSSTNTTAGPSLKKKNSTHPNNNDSMKEEDEDGYSNYDEKSQSGIRSTPNFLDLEKTLMQQKQQLSQVHGSNQNIYNSQGSNGSTNLNLQKKTSNSSVNSIGGQQQQQNMQSTSSTMLHHHHHHHHLHSNQISNNNNNNMANKAINGSYQAQSSQNKQITNTQQSYYSSNGNNINTVANYQHYF